MAEERNDILVTPARTMSADSSLRNSTGKTSTSSSREKIIPPHYLRASTGSCHDFCKYGRQHAFEAKGKRRIPKRVRTIVTEGVYSLNTERKKKPSVKLRPFLDSKTQFPNISEIIKQVSSSVKKREASSKQVLLLPKKIGVSPRQASPSAKTIVVSPKQAVPPDKEIEVSPQQAVSPVKKIKVSPKQAVSPAKKIEISPKQALSSARKIEISPKQVQSSARRIGISPKQVLSSARKIETSPKQPLSPAKKLEASTKQTSFPAKRDNSSPKPGSPLKPNSIAAKPSPPSGLLGGMGGKRNSDLKIVKKMATSKIDEKKALRPLIASVSHKPSVGGVPSLNTRTYKIDEKKALRPPKATVSPKPSVSRVLSLNARKYKNVKPVSSLKSQNKVKKAEPKLPDPVKEKTLYVIEQPESKSLELAPNGTHITQSSPSPSSSALSSSLDSSSSQSSPLLYPHVEEDNEESESMLSEAVDSISEYDETEEENQVETLNMEDKKFGRGAVHSETTDCPPRKLTFRRGSVVNIQTENNGPRRLKFRQGRLLGENDGKGGIGRRSFRRRRDGDTDGTRPESEKVVLRHQDVQGKKNAQGLFNNVIEETASKLVETRKSKVKALVGAFETVISLQESKPSTC
ncbi:neurofilament heavy polypeptide-like [Telopea speciosissima]|uniref:neurofilament heavy polypeptide-like n=1 Tax=Telopea speciosissima TaxID=54955 RepID=UPI001CC4531C|nr:neurofilament heavy polypeptide-like [Telopea speciosissima]XP_043704164.1 neurofilament heavy polypeptide-like [Telopea speciosissima]XP_043704165.1 neurofilament heavy polypeptide-like [Telopea speciosissima]XP_043704166.1 neurofilament heavy polypeptide-like [Telopea speciosissima]